MSQPDRIHALDMPEAEALEPDMERYFEVCREKIGFVPNVLEAFAFSPAKLRNFVNIHNELMLDDSGLSKLEREMIATVVSSLNHCYYCLVAHGATVRKLSGDPVLGELMAMNYRKAELDERQRAMLDFAVMITERSHEVGEAERQKLRDVGFSDPDIWDIIAVASFFNMTNRMASALDQMPNLEYHALGR